MKFLNGEHYLEVKDKRYRIHPTEFIPSTLRDPPNSLRTQYQVQNKFQIRKNQKVIKNDNDELTVKNHPKEQPNIQQRKSNLPSCPSCTRNNWLEFDKGYYCENCDNIIIKQKYQVDKKLRRQDRDLSTRLPYANKKTRDLWMKMVTTQNISTGDVINKLLSLKGKKVEIF